MKKIINFYKNYPLISWIIIITIYLLVLIPIYSIWFSDFTYPQFFLASVLISGGVGATCLFVGVLVYFIIDETIIEIKHMKKSIKEKKQYKN